MKKTKTQVETKVAETQDDNKIDIVVIKRDGKKTSFDGTKIAVAIQKGFHAVNEDTGERKWKYLCSLCL